MNILLTNDDGIYSRSLLNLAKHLLNEHNVTIIAPINEKSGTSHSFTIFDPLKIKAIILDPGITGFAINGSPSDCVKIGVQQICKQKPDLVISGINIGENTGISAYYSGTVAAAREGALMGIFSIALSATGVTKQHFDYIHKWINIFLKNKNDFSFYHNSFLNINFPACRIDKIKGTKLTTQGITPFSDTYEKRIDPSGNEYFWLIGKRDIDKSQTDNDEAAISEYVTVTPLSLDATDKKYINEKSNVYSTFFKKAIS